MVGESVFCFPRKVSRGFNFLISIQKHNERLYRFYRNYLIFLTNYISKFKSSKERINMNPRVVVVIDGHGVETIRIAISSPEEERKGELLLSSIQREIRSIDLKIKRCHLNFANTMQSRITGEAGRKSLNQPKSGGSCEATIRGPRSRYHPAKNPSRKRKGRYGSDWGIRANG